jgi:branched-chain amino acid transport system substrate-binding protein
MKRLKAIALACSLVIMPVTITGCGVKAQDAQQSNETIKLGVNLELTGDVAEYGVESLRGIELAIDEINSQGGVLGRQIELVKIDNASNPQSAANAAETLAKDDSILAVLGPAISPLVIATIPISEKYKIPIISPAATADEVTVSNGKLNEYIYRISYNDSFQGEVMGVYAANELNLKKAIVLSDPAINYSRGLADSFIQAYTKAGGTIVADENINSNNTDFTPILTKIKDMNFDVIYLPVYYETAGRIIKQARQMGITQPILGGDGFDDEKLDETVGNNEFLNNIYYTSPFSIDEKSPIDLDFISKYEQRYSNKPTSFNALGYDLGRFIAAVIKLADDDDRTKVKEALTKLQGFSGVTGPFYIDEQHNPNKSTVITKLVDGVKTFQTKFAPIA